MTRDEFFRAPLVCPYCSPTVSRAEREIPSQEFDAHRAKVHDSATPCSTFNLAFAARDEELIEAARQRAFERSVTLGQEVSVWWTEGARHFEVPGKVVVLGAGFFRVMIERIPRESAATATEAMMNGVRVPEYGCDGWSRNNCIRPVWESFPGREKP